MAQHMKMALPNLRHLLGVPHPFGCLACLAASCTLWCCPTAARPCRLDAACLAAACWAAAGRRPLPRLEGRRAGHARPGADGAGGGVVAPRRAVLPPQKDYLQVQLLPHVLREGQLQVRLRLLHAGPRCEPPALR